MRSGKVPEIDRGFAGCHDPSQAGAVGAMPLRIFCRGDMSPFVRCRTRHAVFASCRMSKPARDGTAAAACRRREKGGSPRLLDHDRGFLDLELFSRAAVR